EPQEEIRRRAQYLRAHVVALALLIARRHRHPEGSGDGERAEPDLLVLRVPIEHQGVAVRHVGHLVAEDHGQLRLVLHAAQEAGVDIDLAVRHGEGGGGRIAGNRDAGGGRGVPLPALPRERAWPPPRRDSLPGADRRRSCRAWRASPPPSRHRSTACARPVRAGRACPGSPWAGCSWRRIRRGAPTREIPPKTLEATPTDSRMCARRY